MAVENGATDAESSGVKFPFPGSFEWLKSCAGGPIKFYTTAWNEALGFAASRLQEQADYVRKLAACKDLAEMLKYNTEFAQKSWARSRDEGARIFEAMRVAYAPTPIPPGN